MTEPGTAVVPDVPLPGLSARLHHVSIAIPPDGAEQARQFYGRLLGLEEREVMPNLDPAWFIWYRVGGQLELHLMLLVEAPPERSHFCLVVDDLDGLRSRLERARVETREGTVILGRPRFTCRDPFGNLIEFARLEA
jgi:catechol 2,3-dioxygenase-like lactoylglutathione lyase family enzyme